MAEETPIEPQSIRHTEDIQEIITKTPSWPMRWGITILCGVFLTFFIFSAFIQYPEMIKAQVTIKCSLNLKPSKINHSGKQDDSIKPYYAEMIISQENIGKVKLGQEVQIILIGYPFEEYGMFKGKVTNIADSATTGGVFISKVSLVDQNKSDLNIAISLRSGMLGHATILVNRNTILHRIFKNIYKYTR